MAKKIFFVLPSLNGGGAEKFFIRLANAFISKDLDVSLILFSETSDYLSLIHPKIKLIYFKPHKFFTQAWLLGRLFKKQEPDIVLSTLTRANNTCILAALFSRVKTKVYVRNTNTLSQSLENEGRLRILLAKILYPFAAGIISPSTGVHEDCIRMGIKNKNMAVIYNCIDADELEKSSKEYAPDLPKTDGPCILTASRFTKTKRIDYIIRAFYALTQQYPQYKQATLCVLGKGSASYQKELENLVHELKLEKKVFFKGFIENPYPFFAQSDLFVLASTAEGLPNVLLAALALKCNIVSTDCPSGPSEILDKGTYGRLIPVSNDFSVLTQTMYEALQKPIDKQKLMGAADRFSVDLITSNYMNFIEI